MSHHENKTVYDQRYQSKENYWDFKPSLMAFKILEWMPPINRRPRVLEVGCGEGGTAVFLARNGYDVTAFDLSSVGIDKTRQNADRAQVELKTFVADINEFEADEEYDIVFSSGTLQYLLPEKRCSFIENLQAKTSPHGLHVLHTFVSKPFVQRAPDAEASEHLWTSAELLSMYRNWETLNFIEEIKACNSSGVPHRHCHNRLWSRQPSQA